jgi:hypothetical protein
VEAGQVQPSQVLKIFFHLDNAGWNGGIVENPDAGDFSSGFFEQLQPPPA